MQEFKLPNLGEGVEKGDVLRILVKVGDRLTQDQPVLELETDKATIEVPSSVEGVIKELKVKAGDKVKPGQVVLVIDGMVPAPPSRQGGWRAAKERQRKEEAAPQSRPRPKRTRGPRTQEDAPQRERRCRAGERSTDGEKGGASAPTEKQEQPAADAGDTEPPKRDDRRASVVDIRGRQPATAAAQAHPARLRRGERAVPLLPRPRCGASRERLAWTSRRSRAAVPVGESAKPMSKSSRVM